MNPELPGDWIDRYSNDELNESELVTFREWMRVNPILRSEVNLDASLTRFLQDAEIIDLMNKAKAVSRQKSESSPLMNFLLVAASFLCLALISGLFYHMNTRDRPAGTPARPNVSQAIQIHSENYRDREAANVGKKQFQKLWMKTESVKPGLLADNFKPMPELELLSGSVTRSSQFVLSSPNTDLDIPADTEVLFSWKYADNEAAVMLVIMDNTGNQVSQNRLCSSGSFSLKTKGFREGLYYWKILTNDDLIIMGKITIYSGANF